MISASLMAGKGELGSEGLVSVVKTGVPVVIGSVGVVGVSAAERGEGPENSLGKGKADNHVKDVQQAVTIEALVSLVRDLSSEVKRLSEQISQVNHPLASKEAVCEMPKDLKLKKRAVVRTVMMDGSPDPHDTALIAAVSKEETGRSEFGPRMVGDWGKLKNREPEQPATLSKEGKEWASACQPYATLIPNRVIEQCPKFVPPRTAGCEMTSDDMGYSKEDENISLGSSAGGELAVKLNTGECFIIKTYERVTRQNNGKAVRSLEYRISEEDSRVVSWTITTRLHNNELALLLEILTRRGGNDAEFWAKGIHNDHADIVPNLQQRYVVSAGKRVLYSEGGPARELPRKRKQQVTLLQRSDVMENATSMSHAIDESMARGPILDANAVFSTPCSSSALVKPSSDRVLTLLSRVTHAVSKPILWPEGVPKIQLPEAINGRIPITHLVLQQDPFPMNHYLFNDRKRFATVLACAVHDGSTDPAAGLCAWALANWPTSEVTLNPTFSLTAEVIKAALNGRVDVKRGDGDMVKGPPPNKKEWETYLRAVLKVQKYTEVETDDVLSTVNASDTGGTGK